MMNIIIDSLFKAKVSEVLSPYPVILAYLFGSAAAGRATPLSDVDIALVVNETFDTSQTRLALELDIANDLAAKCSIPNAQVHIVNRAAVLLRGEVVTRGILLFSRDEAVRIDFETRTRSEYFDFLPIASELREAHFEQLLERGLNG
jgi:uncharacterized protein